MDSMEMIQKIVTSNAIQRFPSAFSAFLIKLVVPLSVQVLELRSAIVKKAGQTISLMASTLGNTFEQAAERYLSANCLLKVVLSGNKSLAENGHEAVLAILENVHSPK